jgi:hypothetical protein
LHENSIWQYFRVMRWNASKPKIIWFMTKEFIVLFLMKCSNYSIGTYYHQHKQPFMCPFVAAYFRDP